MTVQSLKRLAALPMMIAAFALSACQTTQKAGTGEIQLSQEVARTFVRDYMEHPYPLAFAVSDGGQYYNYRYCDGPRCRFSTTVAHRTLEECKTKSNLPCHLFAIKKGIVWTKADGTPYTLDDIYAVLNTSAEKLEQERYSNLSNLKLCEGAFDVATGTWTQTYTRRLYVAEVERRGMKAAFCASLMEADG